jgi:hypothetical protein
MSERTLKSTQIASLLVSTSRGTGFLRGTGELALRGGDGGLSLCDRQHVRPGCARRARTWPFDNGQSIWTRLDHIYGASVGRAVALLSLVWMTGVLAAQIRGGTAILTLAGIGPTAALLFVDGLLICLSTLRLSWLAAGFAICMLACNLALMRTLFLTDGLGVWLHAPVQFLDGLQGAALDHTGFMCRIDRAHGHLWRRLSAVRARGAHTSDGEKRLSPRGRVRVPHRLPTSIRSHRSHPGLASAAPRQRRSGHSRCADAHAFRTFGEYGEDGRHRRFAHNRPGCRLFNTSRDDRRRGLSRPASCKPAHLVAPPPDRPRHDRRHSRPESGRHDVSI